MKDLYSLLTLFTLIVIPLWLILHYRNANRRAENDLPREAEEKLNELHARLDSYRSRIDALEAILDEHHPKWRDPR